MEDKYTMSQPCNILYAKRNIVDSIYSEAKIEGLGVIYPVTQEIIEGRAVAGLTIDETLAVNNLKCAWQFILDNIDYPVDLHFIKQLNNEVGDHIVFNAGVIRQEQVHIDGTTWIPDLPNEDITKETIESILLSTSTATDKALDLMLYIMQAHLFTNGNKSTAQIIANKILIENGAGVLSIPVIRKEYFIKLLISFYETNDSVALKEFLYKEAITGLKSSMSQDFLVDYTALMTTDKVSFTSDVDQLSGTITKNGDTFTMDIMQQPYALQLLVTSDKDMKFVFSMILSDGTKERCLSGETADIVSAILPRSTEACRNKLRDIVLELLNILRKE